MRIVWVTRSFLDYRVAVFNKLSELCGGDFYLIYNKCPTPARVIAKVEKDLGNRAIGFENEISIGNKFFEDDFANKSIRIPYQPNLIKTINRLKPDVVVTDGFFQWTYAAIILRALFSVPHVMLYERTMYIERNAQWYRRLYRKLVLKWIDAIGCSGELCAEYVKSLGYPAEKITYGHMVADTAGLLNSVNEKKITVALDPQVDSGNKTIYLYSGQMIPRKGVAELLTAWRAFDSPDAFLILCGDGAYRNEYEKYCEDNNLRNIRFTGYVSYDVIQDYYRQADIFIIPTLEDNWSLVVSEAMAMGLPIITTIYNGCHRELVTDLNGWSFDSLNHDEFVDILHKSFAAKDRFSEMGKESLKIIEGYTPDTAAKSIFKMCEKVCAGAKFNS